MPENTQVQARLILRNDTVGNWNAAETEVLMQGEVGIEFQTDMTAKIKIGDGTKPWSQLPYFGGTATKVFQVGALTEIGSGEELHSGDVAIVKTEIGTGTTKYSYTAYVYSEDVNNWVAMDGNYSASNVYFDDDFVYTEQIGTLSKPTGSATFNTKGKSLKETFASLLAKEDSSNLRATYPSISVGGSLQWREQGSAETSQSVAITFNPGAYKYPPTATGITATNYHFNFNSEGDSAQTSSSKTIQSGTFVGNSKKSIVCYADYSAGNTPKSNIGTDYPDQAFPASATSTVSRELFGSYIPMYYGFKVPGSTITPASISAAQIKSLGSSVTNANAFNKTMITSVTASATWQQFFYAVPKEYNKTLNSATDSNGLPLTVSGPVEVDVTFGTDITTTYQVYYISLDAGYDTRQLTLSW